MQIQPVYQVTARQASGPLPLSEDERQELDQYTDRLRPELGKLQTPPIGLF